MESTKVGDSSGVRIPETEFAANEGKLTNGNGKKATTAVTRGRLPAREKL